VTEVIVPPDLWPGDQEGVLLGWLYGSGAQVSQGDVIAEVTVEKSQFEIFAPASGTLNHRIEEEAIIRPGDLIATII